MGPCFPGCVKSPSFNLRVEHLSQFHAYGKQIPLVTSARRWQLRKQFCASLAHATFHTACFAGTTSTKISFTPVGDALTICPALSRSTAPSQFQPPGLRHRD